MMWGRPDEADVDEMCAAHEVGANPAFAGHASLIDVRSLESVDILAFQRLLRYLIKRREAWSPNVSRQVVLHGGGYAHAVVLGMFDILRPNHRVVFLQDPLEAYRAVGAADVCVELEALRAELLGTPDIVRELQRAFEELAPHADADAIAKRLRTSRRSLQRRLAAAHTTLSAEHKRHLLRASERLLEHSDLDLSAIAAAVGASSASHLVTLFRKHHAMTPGEFRRTRTAAKMNT